MNDYAGEGNEQNPLPASFRISLTDVSDMANTVQRLQSMGAYAVPAQDGTAVESQTAALSQVTEGVDQISSVVQTNSASSEESAAVSAELFEQVHLLQEQTRKFHLKQESFSY